MDLYQRALELQEETVKHRRYFHANAEVGLELPKAVDYVKRTLEEMGLQPKPCGHGITATLGKGGRVFLLRADMDALPMGEESGESFACQTGREAHTCGHDLHAAMLLTAAKLLKEREEKVKGRVKFMFQPGEEILQGAKDMIQNGILEDPAPDGALGCHVGAGRLPVGTVLYNAGGILMPSVDGFRLTVHGKGAHGAYPHQAVDPISIGSHIVLAWQGLIAREADPAEKNILSLGRFHAGELYNVIPERSVLEGALRCGSAEGRKLLLRRLEELAEKTAQALGGSAELEILAQAPPLICEKELTGELVGYLQQLQIPDLRLLPGIQANASEDFAFVAEKIPSVFLYLSAGFPDARGDAPAHNPKVRFSEAVLPIGAAVMAHCALRWLENHP